MLVLTVDVLGPLEVRLSEDVALVFESNKAKALLAYLAVESDKTHSREAVANMFWPNRSDAATLANLRHTLASLRKSLCDKQLPQDNTTDSIFSATTSTIRLNTGNIILDLQKFEELIKLAEQERGKGLQNQIDRLSGALHLVRGRFMEGFSIHESPEFGEWVLLQRERIDLKLRTALHNLVNAWLAIGEWEQALSTLYRLLEIEPWDEGSHRKLMSILASHGNRNTALNQYERCRALLKEDLGVDPDEETIQLYEQIRSGKFLVLRTNGRETINGKQERTTLPTKEYSRNQFVGRENELAWLKGSLEQALQENGKLAFITGETGCGKTRLAWEFCDRAMKQNNDLLVAAGYCNSITGFEDPFLPFRDITQMLISGKSAQPGIELSPEYQSRLTAAFPDILKSFMTVGTDLIGTFISREALIQRIESFGPLGRSWLREFDKELFSPFTHMAMNGSTTMLKRSPNEAIINMLTELARIRPLILFIDDMQWADDHSINLLHYLSKRMDSNRIFILGAYRHPDVILGRMGPNLVWERHPLQPLRLELVREYGEVELNLDLSEGASVVEKLIDQEANGISEAFRKLLLTHTDGNPLFTIELLRNMEKQGYLQKDAQGLWMEAKPFDWQKLPARIEAIIDERISRVPDEQQMLLRAASVEGETFSSEIVARVLKMDEDQVLRSLSGPLCREHELVSAISMTRTGYLKSNYQANDSRYRFNHLLFQIYLYNHLDPVERSTLHEATGIAFEELYGSNTIGNALKLAWHFEEAGLFYRAAQYLLQAGKLAAQQSAYNRADSLYERCLELICKIPESPERHQLEVQVQLDRQKP